MKDIGERFPVDADHHLKNMAGTQKTRKWRSPTFGAMKSLK